MPDWRPALRARLATAPIPDTRRAQLVDELAHHLDEYCRDLVAGGLTDDEAVRATLVELDRASLIHVRLTPTLVAARPWRAWGLSWLDVRLGIRIWLKDPALSIVSVIGIAVSTAIGAAYFAGFSAMLDPSLPLDEGDRIVVLQNVDVRSGTEEERILHDFVRWQQQLRSIDDLAAMQIENRNVIVTGQATRLVRVAKMTAAGFRVARVAPVLGRLPADSDEQPGAPPVILISEETWQTLFDRDADVLGRVIQLGTAKHTVVGVMPAGFRFPLNNHLWVPLQPDPAGYKPRSGPAVHVFGRLADGVSIDAAGAELSTIGARLASENPNSHEGLQPQVLPYTYPFNGIDNIEVAWWGRVAQFAIGLLVAVVAVNVAILFYARTATRAGEIAVRTALGASRRRIVAQLFVEALVLSSAAATLGLAIAGTALWFAKDVLAGNPNRPLPFWIDLGLSPGTAAYVAGLAILAGVIVGVVPGLKTTGRRLQAGLQQMSSRASSPTLGRLWSALIVAQVAIAVAALPFALYVTGVLLRGTNQTWPSADGLLSAALTLPSDEVVSAVEGQPTAAGAEYRNRAGALLRRLADEPTFAGVTFATRFPGSESEWRFEVAARDASAPDAAAPTSIVVRINHVDTDFFDILNVPVLQGRGFEERDARDQSSVVVVNGVFAERLPGGGPAIGRHIRRITRIIRRTGFPDDIQTGPWLRIVGVVPDLAVRRAFFSGDDPRVYQPVAADTAPVPLHLMVRVRGTSRDAAGHLRNLASEVDAGLQLSQLQTVAEIEREATRGLELVGWAVAMVTLSVLLLSAAGIYALTSFTVTRRRREIGIRTALGATPGPLLRGLFARASAQLSAGVLAGLVLAAAIDRFGVSALGGRAPALLPAVAALMVLVGLLATLGPARRALGIPPTEALRED